MDQYVSLRYQLAKSGNVIDSSALVSLVPCSEEEDTCVILEEQLRSVMSSSYGRKEEHRALYNDDVQSIIHHLLDVYNADDFPIRRAR